MKFFAVFSPIIACAAAFAANNHSEQLDAPNGGDAFVFVQPLKIAYPQNIAESDKPAFLEKARARLTSPLLREVVITTEAVKCESASKKFSAPYPNKSAREIIAENFSIEPTSDPEIVNVKFAGKILRPVLLFGFGAQCSVFLPKYFGGNFEKTSRTIANLPQTRRRKKKTFRKILRREKNRRPRRSRKNKGAARQKNSARNCGRHKIHIGRNQKKHSLLATFGTIITL